MIFNACLLCTWLCGEHAPCVQRAYNLFLVYEFSFSSKEYVLNLHLLSISYSYPELKKKSILLSFLKDNLLRGISWKQNFGFSTDLTFNTVIGKAVVSLTPVTL